MERRFLHPDRFSFVPPLMAGMIRILYKTCHFITLGEDHEAAAARSGPPLLYTCWHFAFPTMAYYFRERDITVMISRSRDGEWAARTVAYLGFRSVRGSSGEGGSIALRQLISRVRSSSAATLMADGSQGPALIAQKGILVLARHTQAPLIPVSMAAHPCWRFPSWDRTVLAKPFARVAIAYGPPIYVPHQASGDQMEEMRKELEDCLNRLTRQAEVAIRLRGPTPRS